MRPASALSRPASSASLRNASGLSRPASSASLRNASDAGTSHAPLMAPASSMSKVHRMPSLNEVEQQFLNFKTHMETMSSDVLHRTKYIREVIYHPNTLGKEFVSQSPRETISPSQSFSSSLPKSSSFMASKKNRVVDNESDSDNDTEVRAVMEKLDRKEIEETENVNKLRRTDSADTEKRARSREAVREQEKPQEKERARESRREKRQEKEGDTTRDKERTEAKETKERKSRTSATPTSIPPTPVSPSSPSTSRKKKTEEDTKLQTRTAASPKKQITTPKSETPTSSYVPSDIHSFINSVLNKESDDEAEQDDYTDSSFGALPKSESIKNYKSPIRKTPSTTEISKTKPETSPKKKTSTKPTESVSEQQQQLTNDYESMTSINSREKIPTSVPSSTSEGPITTVPKLAIPKFEPESFTTPKKSASVRSHRGPVGPVFDEPDTFEDEEFEYMDEKIAEKRGQPTFREMNGYKSFRTPSRPSTPTQNNNTNTQNNTINNINNNIKTNATRLKINIPLDDDEWNMNSIIT